MVMLWFLCMWEKARRPYPINLIELGPGTGVMMMDMLRVRLYKLKYFLSQYRTIYLVFMFNAIL